MKYGGIIYNIIEVKIIRKIIRVTALLTAAAILSAGVFVYFATAPTGSVAIDLNPAERTSKIRRIYDGIGKEIFEVNGMGRLYTAVPDLPEHTVNAFIAIEDTRYFEHDGFDLRRIASAALKDILTLSVREGASTITQQLAKNLWLDPQKTLSRKIAELKIARCLEKKYSKEQILEMYLNSLYFGSGIYGISSAARRFFGVDADRLDLGQSAMLAGIINNPSVYDPYKHNDAAESRKRLVLRRMLECGFITEREMRVAKYPTPLIDSRVNGDIFALYALRCGDGDVITEYDFTLQQCVKNAVEKYADADAVISAIVLDVRSEKPVAAAANTYVDISAAKRQAGSTVKPLICYAPALETGLITPVTPMLDKPVSFDGYRPANYGGIYYGWVTAAESLSRSLNVPAVKLLDMIGISRAKDFAARFGLHFSDNDNGLSMALGSSFNGEDLFTLARAYCRLARCDGSAVSRETAYLITAMLEQCADTGTAKSLSGIPDVAAKTGTVGSESGNSDAYCIAYNPGYVVAVWAGSDGKPLPDGFTGGGAPAEICAEILKNSAFYSGAFKRPDTVVSVAIDASELQTHHKVVRADSRTPLRDRMPAEFSIYNMPESRLSEDIRPGDYDNFRIIDGFVD